MLSEIKKKLSKKEKEIFNSFENHLKRKLDDVLVFSKFNLKEKDNIPFFNVYDYLDRTHDCNLLGEQKRRLFVPKMNNVSESKIVTVEKLADGAFSRVYIDKKTNTVYTIYDSDEDISKQVMVDYMNSEGDLNEKLNFPNFTDYGQYMYIKDEEVKKAQKIILKQSPNCTFPYRSKDSKGIELRMVSSPYYQEVGKAKGFRDRKINERAKQLIDFLANAQQLSVAMNSQERFLKFSDIVGLTTEYSKITFEEFELLNKKEMIKLSKQLKNFLKWFHEYQKNKYNEQRNIIQLDIYYQHDKKTKQIEGRYWNFALNNKSYKGKSSLINGRELVFLDPFIIY